MAGTSKKQELEIEGRRVSISNPDKVLYPSGYTKGQVIDYYIRASAYVLPHLAGRPITLKRYPNGVSAKHFYEKDAPAYTPEWVRTFPVPRRTADPDIRYVVIDDLPSLVWCANTASIELHPFLHRVPRIDRPTSLVFDLDPGEGADVLACAEVAFLLKDKLETAGLLSFAKVSGSKGIQVYIPLNSAVTYAQTQPYAHRLAQELEREHPTRVVSAMAKALRAKKVFIDWSQNTDFKTTVGVYSLRAKRSTPYVSLPVGWDELTIALRNKDPEALYFEPEPALERLKRNGDLFLPVLTLKQRLPAASPPNHSGKERDGSKVEEAPPARRPRKSAAPAGARQRSDPLAAALDKLPEAELRFIESMRAQLAAKLPEGDSWEYEIKFDGYRALTLKKAGEVSVFSRNKLVLNRRFPTIPAALAGVEDGTMLDGEIVAVDAHGRPAFNALQNYRTSDRPVYYYVFDLLAFRGKSLLHLPLAKRREFLAYAGIAKLGEPIRISEPLHASADHLIRIARDQKLEGLLAKRLNSIYEPGARTGAWMKFKINQSQELVVGGYIPGKLYFDSLLAGYYEGAKLIFVAKVKNGFVPHTRKELFERLKGLQTEVCPFTNLPEPKNARRGEALTAEVMKKCQWLKPLLVAEVEFTDWTAANHLRHSRYAGLRDDKDPHEVVHESAA